jgi:YHS domain-containing protein
LSSAGNATGRAAKARRRESRKARHGVGFILRLIRFIAWILFATWLGRKVLAWLFGSEERAREHAMPRGDAPRRLHRDPLCGTHVPEQISVTLEHGGQTLHFCSQECREKYRAAHPAAAGSNAASA